MNRQIKLLGVVLTTMSVFGSTQISQAKDSLADNQKFNSNDTLLAKHHFTYSDKFVQLYTSNCSNRLQQHGKPSAAATSICQCSLGQMQQKHNEGKAISILMGAQVSLSKDPRTGLPSSLSQYFTPCLSKVG